jgi:hypothetical protein
LAVGTSHGHLDSLDSPRPGLEGSHHLPPYSILYVCLRRLHPNGFLSRDSQSGVPKLSRFRLPGLWTSITSRLDLRSGRGLNQTCSPPRELSNVVSHFTCRRRVGVDSRLLVVGSQTVSLTPGPSFAHNLGSLLEILSFATSHYATGMQLVVVCNYLGHVCNYKFGIV